MAKVQFFGGGGVTLPSGVAGAIQFSNVTTFNSDAANIFWDDTNNRLGVGISSSLLGNIHVKGTNDSTGSSLYIQSQTNPKLIISNNDTHAINGAVSVADNLKITGNLGFTYSRSDDANWFKANSATYHGFDIKTSISVSANGYPLGIIRHSNGNPAFRFLTQINTHGLYFQGSDFTANVNSPGIEKDSYGGTVVRGYHVGSNESSEYNAGAVNLDAKGTIGVGNSRSRGVNIYNTFSDTSFGVTYRATNIKGTYAISSGANGAIMLNIDPVYNQTGGTATFTGIDYNPTLTALTGAHYGLRIRSGSSGFGLGATLPTSTVHIKGNGGVDHTTSSFRVENSANTASFTFRDDGSFVLLGNNAYGGANTPILSMRDSYHEIFIGGSGFSNASYITQSFCFSGNMSSTRFQGLQIENGATVATLNATSGSYRAFEIIGSRFGNSLYGVFNPTSGTATYTHINLNTGINQTGTASGRVVGIDYNPDVISITGAHYGVLIRPNALNGFGLGTTLPTATVHVKGSSNTTGNVFKVENLANTASFSIGNDGISTFAFNTGGKVLIAAPVGSGETLLEIRRTASSSGGFIFRSGNALSQEMWTTNGGMYLGTPDDSEIGLYPGLGKIILNTQIRDMTALHTGQQITIGQKASSSLNHWLNYGYNASYGSIFQSAQNGATPTSDTLSFNPYGGSVGFGAVTPTATVTIAPSTTAKAPLNIAAGTAPTAPNNGDIWTEGTDLKIRLGGTTYIITKTV